MHRHRPILAALTGLVLAARFAHAERVDTGSVLLVNQPPFSNVLVIGVFGSGSVRVDGGTTTQEDAVALGGQTETDGSLVVTGAGSRLTTLGDAVTRANGISVGYQGSGSIEVSAGGIIDVDGTNTLADDPGVGFGVGVEQAGSGAVVVAGAGSSLLVRNGAAANSGISVGYQGDGMLEVRDGGLVRVDTGTGGTSGVTVAFGPQSHGTLVATGAGSSVDLVGTGTGLTVGNAGTGTLRLDEGAVAGAQVAFLGLESTGNGTVEVRNGATLTLSGPNPLLGIGGFLGVGLAGTGALDVVGGTVVLANPDGGHGLQVGGTNGCAGPCPFTGGSGVVSIDGATSTLRIAGVRGGATIGADGEGVLTIRRGGTFVIEDPVDGGMIVGGTPASRGRIEVRGEGSRLDAGSGLLLGLDTMLADTGEATLLVVGAGTVTAPIVWVGTRGRLAGDGVIDGSVENLRGTIAPGGLVPGQALAVHGGVTQGGGRLRVRAAGTARESTDRLAAQAQLTLTAGAVHVDFFDGYLPRVGDEIIVATAGGGVQLDPAVTASYAGAAPGLSVALAVQGTELRFRALTDARSHGACQTSQLRSFAFVCRKFFACEAAFVKTNNATARDACRGTAEGAFAKSYDAARRKADRRGASCGLNAPAADTDDTVTAPATDLAEDILKGWSAEAEAADDALRRRLLGDTGTLCGALLDLAGAQVRPRSAARARAAGRRARGRFTRRVGKAIAKATKAGVSYKGPAAEDIVAAVDTLVRDVGNASAGVVP